MSDPLNAFEEDLTNVETSAPVLVAGLYKVGIKDIKAERKEDKQRNELAIQYRLEQNAQSVDGKLVNPGIIIFDRMYKFDAALADTDAKKAKANEITNQNLARIMEAALGAKGVFNPADLIGKELFIRLKVEDSTEYGKQNRVQGYVKLESAS